MYKRNAQGWSKHFDFLVLDVLALQIAFILAFFIRNQGWVYSSSEYRKLGVLFFFADILVIVLNNSFHNVIKRGYLKEAGEHIKHSIYVLALIVIYFFTSQLGVVYSRLVLGFTFILYVILGYLVRVTWKYILRHTVFTGQNNKMLVVSTIETAEDTLSKLLSDTQADYSIVGLVLLDSANITGLCGIPVVTDIKKAPNYIAKEWIDSVYVDAPINDKKVSRLMEACAVMAVPTHYHVPTLGRSGVKRFSEKIGGTTVLTTAINYATPFQAVLKRFFDIVVGLIGSVFAIIIMLIVGPIIKIQSPGPILFKQKRIGKNGKHITIYKLRSMRMDAEDMKQEHISATSSS